MKRRPPCLCLRLVLTIFLLQWDRASSRRSSIGESFRVRRRGLSISFELRRRPRQWAAVCLYAHGETSLRAFSLFTLGMPIVPSIMATVPVMPRASSSPVSMRSRGQIELAPMFERRIELSPFYLLHASCRQTLALQTYLLKFNGGGGVAFPVPLRELHRVRARSRAEASGAVHTCRRDIRLKSQARPLDLTLDHHRHWHPWLYGPPRYRHSIPASSDR